MQNRAISSNSVHSKSVLPPKRRLRGKRKRFRLARPVRKSLRRARQPETGSQLSEWLRSPGLQAHNDMPTFSGSTRLNPC